MDNDLEFLETQEDSGVDEAYSLINEIQELAGDMPERAEEFVDSVVNKALEIKVTIERKSQATPNQIQALRNMLNGMKRWIK